ncbi:hypothetical protein BJ944DRAFT_25677 [Cunninghamella echinulata]|nr:hypothetical protein BJ944DRAFT_25677 [Cunninghamella echinulata]
MAEVAIPKTFANNFWGQGDAGYHVLTSKMTQSKKTFDDLRAFYGAISNLHEEFGRKLLKHLKNELGRDETGTLGELLASAHNELEFTAKSHMDLANKIKVNLELPLDNFILEQKDQRKLVQTNVDKAHRNKQLHETHVTKAKEKYENECARQVKIESQIPTVGLREAERLKIKLEKCIHDVKVFEQEYKSACVKLADTTTKWDKGWESACEKFQEMEVKRIEFIHHSFSIYINILSTSTNHDQESYERFWKSLDQCDPQKDIAIFIDEKGTGGLIPDPPVFVHYLDDPAKTLPTFHAAQSTDNINKTRIQNNSSDQPNINQSTISITNNDTQKNQNNDPNGIQRNPSIVSHSNTNKRIAKQLPFIKKKDEQISTKMNQQSIYATNNSDTPIFTTSSPSTATTRNNTSYTKKINTVSHFESETKKHNNINEEDIVIDPRAKVMFSIGNNIFQIDNNQILGNKNHVNQQKIQSDFNHLHSTKKSSWNKRKSILNKDSNNNRLDETFDLSIKELLQELGVQDNNSSNDIQVQDCLDQQYSNNDSNAHTKSEAANYHYHHHSKSIPTENNHHNTQEHPIDPQPTLYMQLQQNYVSGKQVENNPSLSSYSYNHYDYNAHSTEMMNSALLNNNYNADHSTWARPSPYNYQNYGGVL